MARPKIDIDLEAFNKLCMIQCTLREIALYFECSEDTIERAVKRQTGKGFADYYAQKAEKGRISLRRKQYEIAMNNNVTMLIWLGKQYLDQTDKREIDQTTTYNGTVTIEQKEKLAEEWKAKILELAPAINEDDL